MAARLGIPSVKMKRLLKGTNFFISWRRVAKYHICNQETADHVAEYIQNHSTNPQSLFLEANPGTGLLTRSLLKKGVGKIVLFQKDEKYVQELMDPVLLDHTSLQKMAMTTFLFTNFYYTELHKIVRSDISKLGNNYRIFSVIPAQVCKYFLSTLTRQLLNPLSFLASMHFETFLIISPVIYTEITASEKIYVADKYTRYSVLLQTLLDISFITKIKLQCIHPTLPKYIRKTPVKDEPNYAYLVKMAPKTNLENIFGSVELIKDYHFFVMHVMSLRKQVIPVLEKWIPGCGPTLIRNGYDMFLTFKDLKPSEIVSLFKLFSTMDDYQHSIFSYAAERNIFKRGLLDELMEEPSNIMEDMKYEELTEEV